MEAFFRFCAEADEIKILDLCFHRYGTIPDLPANTFIDLMVKAIEEDQRAELYQAWVSIFPLMQRGEIKFKSFKEYYDHCTGKDIDQRPAEEILAEVAQIRAEIRKE